MELLRKSNACNSSLKLVENDGVKFLKVALFEKHSDIVHGFSTRLSGKSSGDFESMNFSSSRGDDIADVKENFERIAKAIGFEAEKLVFSEQMHTTNVHVTKLEDVGCVNILPEKKFTNTDAFITNEKGIALAAFFADCVPIMFYDPVKKSIGVAHSGWKGTAGRIGAKTIEALVSNYECNREDIICAVGPCICGDCYEVSEDVASVFMSEFPAHVDEIMINKGNGKYDLDLWKTNEIILLEAGIKKEKLAMTDLCTKCNYNVLWSRRGSPKGGTAGAFISIR